MLNRLTEFFESNNTVADKQNDFWIGQSQALITMVPYLERCKAFDSSNSNKKHS